MRASFRFLAYRCAGLCLGAACACVSLDPLSSYSSGGAVLGGSGPPPQLEPQSPSSALPEAAPDASTSSSLDAGHPSSESLPEVDTSALGADAAAPPALDAGASCSGAGEFLGPSGASCYRQVNAAVSAAAALAACRAWGGELVEIDSAEEDDFLGARLPFQFWIGASDVVTEGQMLWSNGSALGFSHWAPGQPDDYLGREDCAVKLWPGGAWNDVTCGNVNPYVCERANP